MRKIIKIVKTMDSTKISYLIKKKNKHYYNKIGENAYTLISFEFVQIKFAHYESL